MKCPECGSERIGYEEYVVQWRPVYEFDLEKKTAQVDVPLDRDSTEEPDTIFCKDCEWEVEITNEWEIDWV